MRRDGYKKSRSIKAGNTEIDEQFSSTIHTQKRRRKGYTINKTNTNIIPPEVGGWGENLPFEE